MWPKASTQTRPQLTLLPGGNFELHASSLHNILRKRQNNAGVALARISMNEYNARRYELNRSKGSRGSSLSLTTRSTLPERCISNDS